MILSDSGTAAPLLGLGQAGPSGLASSLERLDRRCGRCEDAAPVSCPLSPAPILAQRIYPLPGSAGAIQHEEEKQAAEAVATALAASRAAMAEKAAQERAKAEAEAEAAAEAERQRREEEEGFDDAVDDVAYTVYEPRKLKLGVPHPDPVVENNSMAAVDPPDLWYSLKLKVRYPLPGHPGVSPRAPWRGLVSQRSEFGIPAWSLVVPLCCCDGRRGSRDPWLLVDRVPDSLRG